MVNKTIAAAVTTIALSSAGYTLLNQPQLDGDIKTKVIEVYDGDTFKVELPNVHKIFGHKIGVRINGIDSPEIKTKDSVEKEHALKAKSFAEEKLLNKTITLKNPKRDKYFRILANVELEDGEDYSKLILEKGLAREYHGEHKDKWEFDNEN